MKRKKNSSDAEKNLVTIVKKRERAREHSLPWFGNMVGKPKNKIESFVNSCCGEAR